MSIWGDIHKRANGTAVKKEDVDTEIASSLDRISDDLDSENPCVLQVLSADKRGWTYTNIIQCHVVNIVNLRSPGEVMHKTLNICWNINKIKSAIGDRKFISLEKL